jgi:GTPase SAR1 family protein
MARKLALIVTNSRYEDGGLARLATPDVDGRALAEVLQDSDIGGFDDVNVLLNEGLATVRKAIARFFDSKHRDDLLLLYFSGHGVRDEQGNLYLAVRDTERAVLAGTAIEASYVTTMMDRSGAKRLVLVLDCSHSGAFGYGAKAAQGASVGTATAFEGTGRGRVVLTATDSTQYAWEGDQVLGEVENSLFTHFMVEGLRTGAADRDEDGLITIDELYDYVYEHVLNDTPKQTPGKWAFGQQGEIVIAQNPRVTLAKLPPEIEEALESTLPSVRLEGVRELFHILRGHHQGLARAAREALQRLSTDDSRMVAEAVAKELESTMRVGANQTLVAPRPEIPTTPGLVRELVEYTNAKVVLVGDSGVGKSGLALVLVGRPFSPTESTHGRLVHKFDSQVLLTVGSGRTEIRDTLLWDLAGQPGYRLVHQLDLSDVAVAVVVFDARSETDPLSGAFHWVRALRQAQGSERGPILPKLLVAARIDRGGLAVSRERVDDFMRVCDFRGYYETSAKDGSNVVALREAISQAIDWDALPKVSSNALFERIRKFVNEEQRAQRVLSAVDDLYRLFLNSPDGPDASDVLRAQFVTCLGRLEALGLIRRLSFGNLVLLQPEMLAGFASALINAARDEPDGFGSITEERARLGEFYIPDENRLQDQEQQNLLLIATIEHLLRHEIAFREDTDLVFPSQLTRENPELPDPEGKAVTFAFEGPLMNVYATLAVRLAHTGLLNKKELWKNAATYSARVGGTAGIFLREIEEGRGELVLFFDGAASEETRFQFEEYVRVHLERRAVPGTLIRRRIFACVECRTPVAELVATRRRERGFDWLACPVCGARVSLRDREERLMTSTGSMVSEMDVKADSRRAAETAVSILEGKIATEDFDVFLCHNSQDKEAVKEIGGELKRHGILPWLDEWELRPGFTWQSELEKQIPKIRSAVVFVGKGGLGPWQRSELHAFLSEFHNRKCPVIPALLPDAPLVPELPVFLRGMTWVDFRTHNPLPIDQLIWGITGERRRAVI